MFDKFKEMLNGEPERDQPPQPDAAAQAKLRALIEQGMKHEAYQLYRSATGGSLSDAMTYVNALEAEMLISRPDIRWGAEWLPAKCPNCGAGIAADTVQWLDGFAEAARCPYCSGIVRAPAVEDEA